MNIDFLSPNLVPNMITSKIVQTTFFIGSAVGASQQTQSASQNFTRAARSAGCCADLDVAARRPYLANRLKTEIRTSAVQATPMACAGSCHR
jgi:hypothetical protein